MALNDAWKMTDADGNPVDQSFKKLLSSSSVSKQDVDKFLNSLDPSAKSALQNLADEMIRTSIQYGVACCHHTCNNINFNDIMMQMSTLSAEEKQKYAEILANATSTQEPNGDASSDAPQGENGGTSNSADSSSSGVTAAGTSAPNSAEANAKSSDPSANSNSQDSGSDAYEVEKSSSKSITSSQSSTPALVIIAVIVLIVLFGIGYVKNRKNE